MKILPMAKDKRRINAAWGVPEIQGGDSWSVGTLVTDIIVYEEPGQGGMVPWIAVCIGDQVWQRRPASTVALRYELETT